jgi:hypothetical protein
MGDEPFIGPPAPGIEAEAPAHGANDEAEMCGAWTDADPFAEDADDGDDDPAA